MLLKIIGSVLILTGSSILGFLYGGKTEKRRRELIALRQIIMLMYSETEFGHTHLAQVCYKAALHNNGALGDIFRIFSKKLGNENTESVSALWSTCIDEYNGVLTKEDINTLKAVGSSLGFGDIKRQLLAFKAVTDYIDCKNNELTKASVKSMKLCRSIGMLLGAFLVIILY